MSVAMIMMSYLPALNCSMIRQRYSTGRSLLSRQVDNSPSCPRHIHAQAVAVLVRVDEDDRLAIDLPQLVHVKGVQEQNLVKLFQLDDEMRQLRGEARAAPSASIRPCYAGYSRHL